MTKDAQKLGKNNNGFKPGEVTNPKGRPAGVPNKLTTDLRNIIKEFAEKNAAKACELWHEVAADDPARAVNIWLDALEYVTPKLQRSELTGADGGALVVKVVKLHDDDNSSK